MGRPNGYINKWPLYSGPCPLLLPLLKKQENARVHQGVPRLRLCSLRGRGWYRSNRCQVTITTMYPCTTHFKLKRPWAAVFCVCKILTENGLVCGSQWKACRLCAVRHTSRTELKLYAPRRCMQEGLWTLPCSNLLSFSIGAQVFAWIPWRCQTEDSMLFGLQARHGCVRNVDGEGERRVFKIPPRPSSTSTFVSALFVFSRFGGCAFATNYVQKRIESVWHFYVRKIHDWTLLVYRTDRICQYESLFIWTGEAWMEFELCQITFTC